MNDSIDLGGLLTIDVDSELRKLSGAQLQGPWQIPAEFIRRALKARATTVDIRIERHGVVITDDGQAIPSDVLYWAATLLDEGKTNEQRHAALTALESTGGLVFLVVAGLRPKYFRVTTGTGAEQLVLEFRGQGGPLLSRVRGNGHPGSEVSIRAPGLDRRQVTHWLTNVCRFPGRSDRAAV